MTSTTATEPNGTVDRMAGDIREIHQLYGTCLEADLYRKGWTVAEVRAHREDALALVKRWQERDDAASNQAREAGRTITPRAARAAVSRLGAAGGHIDFAKARLHDIGTGGRIAPLPPGSRLVRALDLAIKDLTALRGEIAEAPASASQAA